jgi:hypothetical protein
LISSANKKDKLNNRYNSNSNDKNVKTNVNQRNTPKKDICEKFKKNPQNFYTENLCDLVIKSLDIDEKKETKKNTNKILNNIDKKINLKAYYNLKKFFEENNLDD